MQISVRFFKMCSTEVKSLFFPSLNGMRIEKEKMQGVRCDYKKGEKEKGFQSMNPATHKSEHNQKRLTSAFNHRWSDAT